MENNQDIKVSFDFSTGDVELVFDDKTSYIYKSELGVDIAELFEELIEQAFDDWLVQQKLKERMKNLH